MNFTTIGGRNTGANGVLTIIPNSGTLNTNEVITLTTSPTSLITNGILPAYMATQNSGGDTALDFLTVDGTNHVIPATALYNSNIAAGPNAVVAVSGATDIGSGTTTVFGLKVNGSVNGAGTLVVGDGSHPGGVLLDGGSSIATNNLSFGTDEGIIWAGGGNGTVSSAITLGSTLTTAGASQLAFNGQLGFTTGSNINVNGATATINGTMASGNLTKQGPGILVISGNQTAFGGSYISNAGTLQIGDGNTSGTISATSNLITNGNIAFNRTDSVTIGNTITGTGNIIQAGTGTTVFTGNLGYSGSAIINAGTARTAGTTLLPTNSTITSNGGTFDLNGLNETILGVNNGTTQRKHFKPTFLEMHDSYTLRGTAPFNGVISNGVGT